MATFQAPFLFSAITIFALFQFYGGCQKQTRISELESDNKTLLTSFTTTGQSNVALIANYQLQVQTQGNRILELIQERDTATSRQKQAELSESAWKLLVKSGDTNTPLTKRLDMVVGGLSNLVSYGLVEREFVVNINGLDVTNTSAVSISSERRVQLLVRTENGIAAGRLTIQCYSHQIEPTNIVAHGWIFGSILHKDGPNLRTFDEQSGWLIESEYANAPNLRPPPFTISTNYTRPYLEFRVTVFSDRVKPVTNWFRLEFQ